MHFVWILGVLAAWFMTAMYYKKIDFARMVFVGSGIYFSLYVIVTGMLVWINHFNVFRTVLLVLIVEVINIALLVVLKQRRLPKVIFNIVSYIPIVIILIVLGIMSSKCTAGFFNTGQDEGLYQLRAMFYINDKNDNVIDFPEYYRLDNQWETEQYKLELKSMEGFYRLSKEGMASEESVSGVLHGVPTFPALLALWGKMFGLENMNGILTLIFLIGIGNVWLIACNMKFRPFLSYMVAVITGVCPIVMWSSKNVLTEIVTMMFFVLFYELITESPKKRLAITSVIPIVAVCFFHITILLFMPVIVITYILSFLYTRQKAYARALVYSLLAYALGLSMMLKVARRYTIDNLSIVFNMTGNALNKNNVNVVVLITCIVLAALILFVIYSPLKRKLLNWFKGVKQSPKAAKCVGIFFIVAIVLDTILFISKYIWAGKNEMWEPKLTIFTFLFTTGFVILPAFVLAMIMLGRRFIKDKNAMIISISILYILPVYCGFVWVHLWYYYYYARYFTPFIFIMVLAGGLFLNYFSWRILAPILSLTTGLVIWQSNLLYKAQDLTYCSYENVQSLASCVGPNDAIIILDQDMGIGKMFFMPLKALTDCDIYFAKESNIAIIAEKYTGLYDDIYVVMYDTKHLSTEDGTWRYVYQGKMDSSIYNIYVDKGMPYAKKSIKFKSPLAVLLYQGIAE